MGMPFYIPQILKDTVLARADDNMFTRNKSKMTGNISISSTAGIDLAAMKEFSKKMGISINDFVLCALTTTLNTIFKENNDPVEEFKIVIPANIRFKFYPTKEEVKLENKFAAIPLTVPTTDKMETSYGKIKRVTGQLRGSLGLIYAVYALSFWSTMLTPRAAVLNTIETMSAKFTWTNQALRLQRPRKRRAHPQPQSAILPHGRRVARFHSLRHFLERCSPHGSPERRSHLRS